MQTYPHQLFIGPRVPALGPEDLETTSFYILFCLSFVLFDFSVLPFQYLALCRVSNSYSLCKETCNSFLAGLSSSC